MAAMLRRASYAAAQACSSGSGSIGADALVAHQPLTQISKCRCGPSERAGVADRADPLARGDRRALGDDDRAGLQVHEDVVAAVVAGDHDVVARALRPGRRSSARCRRRRDDRRALGGGDVLALVGVAGAAGAEARALAAEAERALDGEDASSRSRSSAAAGAGGGGGAGATTLSGTRR